jgi:hypothetical protein
LISRPTCLISSSSGPISVTRDANRFDAYEAAADAFGAEFAQPY